MPTRILTSPAKDLRPAFIAQLKTVIGRCEHPRCPVPTAPVGIDRLAAHEGLVAFAEMQKVENSKLDMLLALSPANVFPLHHMPCHSNLKPSKEECVEMLKKRSVWFWEEYGYPSARAAVAHFYGRLKELQEEGIFKQFPSLPTNLEILN